MTDNSIFATNYSEADTSDSTSSIAKNTSLDSIEDSAAHFAQLSDFCNIDELSNENKKIRKKRCAYDKIDDEKRIQLLNAVQKGGESLKSAATRLQINYSSAKSILHTFRKEGRILKKSPFDAPNRYSLGDLPSNKMDVSPMNNGNVPKRFPSQGSLIPERKSTGAYSASNGPNSPMRGLTSIFANLVIESDETDEEPSFIPLMLEAQQKPQEQVSIPSLTKLSFPSFLETEVKLSKEVLEETPINKALDDTNITVSPATNQILAQPLDLLKKFDNFYMNYSNSPLSGGRGNLFGDHSGTGTNCAKEFESFSDLMNAFIAPHTFHTEGDHHQRPTLFRLNSCNSSQDKAEVKLMKHDSSGSNISLGGLELDNFVARTESPFLMCESLKGFLSDFAQFQKSGASLLNERNK